MVTLITTLLVFQPTVLNSSFTCDQSAFPFQLFQRFIEQEENVKFHTQNHHRMPEPFDTELQKKISLKGNGTPTCISGSSNEFNASFDPGFLWFVTTDNDHDITDAISWPMYHKILQCSGKTIIFSFKKWKPRHAFSNHICIYHYEGQQENDKANVTDVHTNSCVILANWDILGHFENVNKRTWNEKKILYAAKLPMKLVGKSLPHNNSTLTIGPKKYPRETMSSVNSMTDQQNKGQGYILRLRKRRSSTISLKPMIFPNLNRKLVERKRNSSVRETEMDAVKMREGASENSTSTGVHRKTTLHDGVSFTKAEIHHLRRQRRETQIMMARYRKEIKRSRKKRRKTTPTSSFYEDNDEYGGVNSTPYTFLNVSFTGYSERQERTTVKPRIQRPLKMSEQDLEFVYGSKGGYEKNSNKGRNNDKSGGWSTKLKLSFSS